MQEYITSLIRHGLTAAAGWLVTKGIIDAAGGEQMVGALLGVVGLGWSLAHKYLLNKTKS